MKTCPQCGELLGEQVDRCFKCGHDFTNGKSLKRQTKICPKCKKIYYNVTYENCTECGSTLALYSKPQEVPKHDFTRITADQFGLNELDPIDTASVEWINRRLFEGRAADISSILAGVKFNEAIVMSYLRALVEQNWVLTRQLNKINKQLEEITKKMGQ